MKQLWRIVVLLQFILSLRVIGRMLRTARGTKIHPVDPQMVARQDLVTVLLPVLNETKRLAPCLDGLISQGPAIVEIIVIDGGSTDSTSDLVRSYSQRDPRVRLLEAGTASAGSNGKAHNLKAGFAASSPNSTWILTIDADVRPKAGLTDALLAHAERESVNVLSAATRQRLSSAGEGLLHPSMLTTLVYRFGIPGIATRDALAVQANGQCMLVKRRVLDAVGGFDKVQNSICEDVTLARLITLSGEAVGFYEAGNLVDVEMYSDWRETWTNWSRSLPMHDRFSGLSTVIGLAEVTLVQAAPVWLGHLARKRFGPGHPVTVLNTVLVITRIGVLFGTARAYVEKPWTYWLSPVCDLPVAIRLWLMAARRQHTWRGRALERGGNT